MIKSVLNWAHIGSVVAATLAVGACASSPGLTCRPGERPAVMEAMYFCTAKPGSVVTLEEWKEFVNRVITPRFPEGLTSWEASGQWQGADGVIARETSRVLHLVRADDEKSERAVNEIVSKYKTEFRQEAVLRVRSRACVSF